VLLRKSPPKFRFPYVACISRFRTKVAQLVNARDDKHKSLIAKMAPAND